MKFEKFLDILLQIYATVGILVQALIYIWRFNPGHSEYALLVSVDHEFA